MKFYTYIYLHENGVPYYVGKGTGKRAFEQFGRKFKIPIKDRILIQHFPSEEDAYAAEKFLIKYYGRKDLGLGPLLNFTDGGDGLSNISEIVRRNISEAQKQRFQKEAPWNKGKRGAQIAWNKGLGMSPEKKKVARLMASRKYAAKKRQERICALKSA